MVAMMQTLHWHYYVCRLSYQRWAVIRKTSLRVYCAVLVPVIQRSIFSPINQWNKSCIYCWSRKTISPIGSMIAICRLLNATFSLNWEPMCTSVRATMMTVFLPTGIQDLLWIRCHHPWNPMGLPMPIHPPPLVVFFRLLVLGNVWNLTNYSQFKMSPTEIFRDLVCGFFTKAVQDDSRRKGSIWFQSHRQLYIPKFAMKTQSGITWQL